MNDVNILVNNGINVQQGLDVLGDIEMYNDTLNDFLDMVAEKLTHLENNKSTDMSNYAIDVHSLKSDAKYLGFVTLADMSYESEMKSKAGDVNFVLENHPKIIAEAKRVVSVAQQYLGREVVDLVPTIGTSNSTQSVATSTLDAQPVAQAQTVAEPIAQAQPVAQPVAQAQPVAEPIAQVQPVAQPVAQAQPVAEPIAQVQPVAQPMAQAQPVAQPVAGPDSVNNIYGTTSADSSIQFFPSESVPQNDVMSQALYNINQNVQPQVAGLKKGVILIIDDSTLVANFVKKVFSNEYDVMIASDGVQGVEIIKDDNVRAKVKACLLDLNMPNMNGFQVMDYFRENGIFVKTPVAIISDTSDPAILEKANSYPIIDILAKPFNDRDIQRVVEKCLAAYF